MKPESILVNKYKGILIVCEGISGSGKSEGVSRLIGYFEEKKYRVALIEWNSNRTIRGIIKAFHSVGILSPTVYSILQWISFLIDYFFKMIPLLNRNYVVIYDRYIYTGLTRDKVNNANQTVGKIIGKFSRKPDLLLFYDTGLHTCYQRIKSRGKLLFHPNQAIHRNGLLKNKELYYLKKIQYQYHKLLADTKLRQATNTIFVRETGDDVYHSVHKYISWKLSNHDETMRLNPNESICYRDRY